MNYSALIQNRRSVREFTKKQVLLADLNRIQDFYKHSVHRLVPQIRTQLAIFGPDAGPALEGAAGYNRFLVGAPQYLVLQSEQHPLAHINGGYIMEDLILKLGEMGLDSCWVTFVSSDAVKDSLTLNPDMEVVAIAAFGYGKKTTKRLRLNIKSMSNVDLVAQHRYMDPKRSVYDMAFLNTWGNTDQLDSLMGFFDDMLWEALYAASLSPSYLNRQAYGFLLREGKIYLVERPDPYNNKIDGDLSLGIVLLHFSAVAENWSGSRKWEFGSEERLDLPQGHRIIAVSDL